MGELRSVPRDGTKGGYEEEKQEGIPGTMLLSQRYVFILFFY
jgi:hypothetical protein